MGKIFRLALSSIRKSKGQSASFLVIALIAALLLNLGLMTWGGYASSFDQKAQRLNAPGAVFVAQKDEPAFLSSFEQSLRDDARIEETQAHPALVFGSEFLYAEGTNSRKAVFFDRSDTPEIGKFSIVEETDEPVEHPVYLPYLFQKGGGYQLGDLFEITLLTSTEGKQVHTYTVAGFYEDIYFATINSTITGFLLSHEEYQNLENSFNGDASGAVFSVKTKNSADNEGVASEHMTELDRQCPYGILTDSNHYALLKSARTVTSSIGASIILGFSFLLLIVSLVIVNFRIRNSVEEEIRNIGALKALGYTSRQLVSAFLLQFTLLALAGSLAGILCSLAVQPALGIMFAAQTGIVWDQPFSFAAAGETLLLVLLLVGIVSFASAVRIRKLPPIVALRTGVSTHNFRSNPFPLEHSRLPLPLSMMAKHLARNKRQSFLICLIVAFVTFSSVFAGVLYYNVNVQSGVFIRMVAGETPHAMLEAADAESARRLLQDVRSRDEVEKAFFFSSSTVGCEEDFEATAYISDDLSLTGNPDWLYQGRFPQYENEVVVGGLLAKSFDKKIGDTIRISKGEIEREYLITGLVQGSNYMGRDLCMTEAAFQRISAEFSPTTISIYLRDQTQTASLLKDLEQTSGDLLSSSNAEEIIRSSMASYQSIVAMLAVIVSLVAVVIIGLVLYLVIKTMLIRKKQELGIQKAIGFTTGQLMLQNALAFLPIILLGALLGCIAGYFLLNPFFSVLFSGIGIMETSFVIYLPMLAAIFGFITLFGFLFCLLISSKIKKITPYTLMSE